MPLCLVSRGRDLTTSARPVDMIVLADGILFRGMFRLDPESVGAKVVSLRLQQVRRQIFCSVPIVEAERGAERRRWDTPQSTFADNVSPSVLGLVDGVLEKVVEEQVLKVRVFTVSRGDIL